MSVSSELTKIRNGFQTSFWVANIMELFERLAYYGQATILSIFLRDHLKLDEIQTGTLSSLFGGLIYALPIFAGALADKFGFKKAFTLSFLMLACGYFAIGATGMSSFAPLFQNVGTYNALIFILIFTAIGGSFIKPSVLGTVALSSTPETKSLGYAIYYWLVNIGAAIGPLFAYFVRDSFGIEKVYIVSSLSCLLMFFATLIFYHNPAEKKENSESLLKIGKGLLTVLSNMKFMIFLLIFSLYWLMFWQIFIIIPFYIKDYISTSAPFEIIESVDAWGIILLQLVVNRLTKRFAAFQAITIGFTISALCWAVIFIHPSLPLIIAGLIVFSIGEQTQAPRYYEYIANLAPKGKEAMFQGYAFLPIAIGWGFGGTLGGLLYKVVAKQMNQPHLIFAILFGIGVLATVLMVAYNAYFKNKTAAEN